MHAWGLECAGYFGHWDLDWNPQSPPPPITVASPSSFCHGESVCQQPAVLLGTGMGSGSQVTSLPTISSQALSSVHTYTWSEATWCPVCLLASSAISLCVSLSLPLFHFQRNEDLISQELWGPFLPFAVPLAMTWVQLDLGPHHCVITTWGKSWDKTVWAARQEQPQSTATQLCSKDIWSSSLELALRACGIVISICPLVKSLYPLRLASLL